MREHYDPKPSSIVQRLKFNTRVRGKEESISTYVAALRELSQHCEYGDTLGEMIRDRLVCGVNHDKIQSRLLSEKALTYEKAMELSLALEAAEKDTRVMKAAVAGNGTAANGTPQPRVPQILYNGKPTASSRNSGFNKPIVCLRCGENHLATVCKYRNTECSKCKKKGHLAKVCLSVGKPGAHVQQQYKRQANKPYKHSKNHYLEGTSDHEEDAYSLFMMKSAKSTDPITLNMPVNSVPVQMELDTGASFSVISESTYKRICKNEPLQESTIRLNTYTGEAIQVLGKLAVKVSHGDQEAELWVQVVAGTGPDLVGRDWLSGFRFTLYNMQALEKPHSTTVEDHLENVSRVLERLEAAGLHLKRSKCSFMCTSIEYLGHIISEKGLQPTTEKVRALKEMPNPKNVAELRSFLGIVNYYGKFLSNLSTKLAPLYSLLHKHARWSWGEEQEQAFLAAKEALQTDSILVHYDGSKPLILACDASPYGLGAVLSHVMADGTERPIAYVSRTLTSAEKNYSQLEKEGLAIVFGVKKFHNYLYGRPFSIESDHQPLSYLFSESRGIPQMASSRIQRWALTLSAYQYTIRYKAGSTLANTDSLSRLPRAVTGEEKLPGDLVHLVNHIATTNFSSAACSQEVDIDRPSPVEGQTLPVVRLAAQPGH